MGAARPEAAYYIWRALVQSQKCVAADIQSWLSGFSELEIPTRAVGKNIFDWQRVDATRASNVVIIDGPRGAGKTSLMLTLVELWRRILAQENLDEIFETPPQATPGEMGVPIPVDPCNVRTALESLRGKIIPIRVLDFSPLPRSTSLITWVAAQLREFIDLLDERTAPAFSDVSMRAVVPWEPDWDKELPSRRAWADLAASAAWGWDDNIEARKGALDPDAYAEELQQSERARVGIVERWRTLIGAIVKDAAERYPGRIKREARIVIPIDDVDMNPLRTTDLLNFVRTFWDPQLVFLLTGDSNLILAALKEHHAKSMGRTGNDGAGFSPGEMAAQSYDKVIPLAQRFRIGPLDPVERVELLSEQLLDKLPDLLRRDRWAAEALPPTLREIHDMRQTLSGYTKMSEVVSAVWSTALAREALSAGVKDRIAQRVDLGRDGMPAIEVDIDAPAERLGEFRVKPVNVNVPGGRVYLVLEAVSGLQPFEPDHLSIRMRGALLLAADLAADDPDAAWSQISIAGHGYKFPAVRARIVVSFRREEKGTQHARDLLRKGVRWPVPDWAAPVDSARFAEEWRKLTPGMLKQRDAQDVAKSFLDQVRSVQQDREGSTQRPTAATSLKDAITAILSERESTAKSPRQQAYADWARGRALLLATPESGLHGSAVDDLLSSLPQTPRLEFVDKARFQRARIMLESLLNQAPLDDDVDATLVAIDGAFDDHPWVQRFGGWSPRRGAEDKPRGKGRSR